MGLSNEEEISDKQTFGIDLGTTITIVAVITEGNKPSIVNFNGPDKIPSVVTFVDRRFYTGHEAETHETSPLTTIRCAKRIMGRTKAELEKSGEKDLISFEVGEEKGMSTVVTMFAGKQYSVSPEVIAACLLKKIGDNLRHIYGLKHPPKVVIAVPAYFNLEQRHATRIAGKIAGMDVLRVVNEPTCAAFAHELIRYENNTKRHVLVYDFGGGTFDVTILRVNEKSVDVLSSEGDSSLGGEDIDVAICNYMLDHLENHCKGLTKKKGKAAFKKIVDQLRADGGRLDKLRKECKSTKEALANVETAPVNISGLIPQVEINPKLSVDELEDIVSPFIARTVCILALAFEKAKITESDIDNVVLVGGSTNLVAARNMLEAKFTPAKLARCINPDEAVALGAAACAYQANEGKDNVGLLGYTLMDITSAAYGIDIRGDSYEVVIPEGTQVPGRVEKRYRSMQNTDGVIFNIREGDDPERENNKAVGVFRLDVTNRPDGVPLLARFAIDRDYNLLAEALALNAKDGSTVPIGTKVKLDMTGCDRGRTKALIKNFVSMDRVNNIASLLNSLETTLETISRRGSAMNPSPEMFTNTMKAYVDEKNSLTTQRWTQKLLVEIEKESVKVSCVSSMCAFLRKIKTAREEDRKVMTELQAFELKELESFFGRESFTDTVCVESKEKAQEIWDAISNGKKRIAPKE